MAGDLAYPVLTNQPKQLAGRTPTVPTLHQRQTEVGLRSCCSPAGYRPATYTGARTAMRFPGMDDALRAALSMGLQEKADSQFITQLITDVSRTDAVAAVDTFATYRTRLLYSASWKPVTPRWKVRRQVADAHRHTDPHV